MHIIASLVTGSLSALAFFVWFVVHQFRMEKGVAAIGLGVFLNSHVLVLTTLMFLVGITVAQIVAHAV